MTDFLRDGPATAPATLLLAHGAGAPMDSAPMAAIAAALADAGLAVARFEFAYMAARRQGQRRPPPRAESLAGEYRAAVAGLAAELGRTRNGSGGAAGPVIIGGKSMGGRVASLVADELHAAGTAAGLLCIGYPFHPPDRPAQLRTAHLARLAMPTLIAQGTRDPFGTCEEVPGYDLSPSIELLWLPDGDHDLRPRKSVSGFTAAEHLRTLAVRVGEWVQRGIAP